MEAQLEPMSFSGAAGPAGRSSAEEAGFSRVLPGPTHLEDPSRFRGEERRGKKLSS